MASSDLTLSLEVAKNVQVNNTGPYHQTPTAASSNRLIVRRGGYLHLTLTGQVPEGVPVVLEMNDLLTGEVQTLNHTGPLNVLRNPRLSLQVVSPSPGVTQLVLRISRKLPIKFYVATVWVGQQPCRAFDVAVIANPYHGQDPCYLGSPQDIQDYLFETQTNVATIGAANEHTYKQWNFGQFHPDVMDFAFLLMQRMSEGLRDDIPLLCREFTAAINTQDPSLCVLQSRWDGQYVGGTSPLLWTGSHQIISQYMNTRRPVNYGQCWVYACLFTTVLRCLGIPSRCVSAVSSATPGTAKDDIIDKFYYPNGLPIKELSSPLWNFHVWTEAWMKRTDLRTSKYDGWQALDASPPFETSLGERIGPAPAEAVKECSKGASFRSAPLYDVEYFYSQIHRTIRSYQIKPGVNPAQLRTPLSYADIKNFFILLEEDPESVGGYILKNSRSSSFENIRHDYKDSARSRSHSRTPSTASGISTYSYDPPANAPSRMSRIRSLSPMRYVRSSHRANSYDHRRTASPHSVALPRMSQYVSRPVLVGRC